jgi:hypothetical protein
VGCASKKREAKKILSKCTIRNKSFLTHCKVVKDEKSLCAKKG